MPRVRDHKTLSSYSRDVSLKSLHSGIREFDGKGGGKEQEPEELEDTKETRPFKSTGLMHI